MKTHKVRPLLIKSAKTCSQLEIDDWTTGKLSFESKSYHCKNPRQLILISLEDVKMKKGDLMYDINDGITENVGHGTGDYKVIATQPQISPELIQQLIDEYNNGGMKDFEIEMIEFLEMNDPTGKYTTYEPKLTNNYITIIYSEHHIESLAEEAYQKRFNAPYTEEVTRTEIKQMFIDGYNARKAEEPIMYSEEACYRKLHNLMTDIHLNGIVINDDQDLKLWFNDNKKK